jgi:hypothetical protein
MGLIGWPELLFIVALLIVVAPLAAIYFIVRAGTGKKEGGGEKGNKPAGGKG